MKKILVFDTETIGTDRKYIYDIGCVVADKTGKVYTHYRALVSEIITRKDLMDQAYYSSKLPMYRGMWRRKEVELKSWADVVSDLQMLIENYEIDTVAAYNANFDIGAIAETTDFLQHRELLFEGMEVWCIRGMALETIFQQKTFRKMAERLLWLTTSKKFWSTTAEAAFRYINVNPKFVEEHTALEDAFIEVEIMAKCFRQKKKMSRVPLTKELEFKLARI